MTGRPALFLDRDGVVNIDHAYVHRRNDFEFIDGIFDLCRHAKTLGYLIIIVTNQAGIGRGYYTEEDFADLTHWMCGIFDKEKAPIDKVYFCPTHPEGTIERYRKQSDLRKPAPGMILLAAKEFDISLRNSILVGDKLSDLEAGFAAGVGSNILYRPIIDPGSASGAYLVVSDLRQVFGYMKRWNEAGETDAPVRP
jgi:D-glycero-D-manno-heptose 1,7-bisphosphate phosphatase